MWKYLNFKNFVIMAGVLLFMSPALAYAQTADPQSSGGAQGISGGTALNWAGYVSDKGSYTSVEGSWVVPTVTDVSANGADATWVGIGGVLTHDLIQVGTEAVPDENGGIDYQAWYELLPAGSQTIALAVHAGDSMTAAITQESESSGTWLITLTDTTTGKSYSTTVSYASSLSSAEWIEEMPAGVGTRISLDDFGTVGFSGGSTTDNGALLSIENAGAFTLTMANSQNQPLAVPSVLGPDGESFSVVRTDAASNSIGIGGIGGGRTFVSDNNNGSDYSNYGTGTTTAITPNVTVSYDGYGSGGYGMRMRYRTARSYSYSAATGNGSIRVVILGSNF